MVATCSKSLANSSIEECQQHAQTIRKGYLAAQWDVLDGIVVIAHSFILSHWNQGISSISSGKHSDRNGLNKGGRIDGAINSNTAPIHG